MKQKILKPMLYSALTLILMGATSTVAKADTNSVTTVSNGQVIPMANSELNTKKMDPLFGGEICGIEEISIVKAEEVFEETKTDKILTKEEKAEKDRLEEEKRKEEERKKAEEEKKAAELKRIEEEKRIAEEERKAEEARLLALEAQASVLQNQYSTNLTSYTPNYSPGEIGGGNIPILESVLYTQVDVDGWYGGQCWDLTNFYLQKLGSSGVVGGSGRAGMIGHEYKWQLESEGFEVLLDPSPSNIKPGDIVNIRPGYGYSDAYYGHTGIVAEVRANGSFVVYEQNAERGQIVAKYERYYGSQDIASIVRKK